MNLKSRAGGLVLAVVMTMAALSASTASAEFHIEPSHAVLAGANSAGTNAVLTVNAGTVTCNAVAYSGTVSTATTSQITVAPVYGQCTAFGFVNAPVDVNGCTETWTTTTTPTPHEAVRLHINCPAGQSIKVTAFNCHVSIGSQTVKGITYTNEGAGATRSIVVHIKTTGGMTYTQESKSFPGCANGTFSNGAYESTPTITGENTFGNHMGVWTSHAS